MTHCTSGRFGRAGLFTAVVLAVGRSDRDGDGYTNVEEFLNDGLFGVAGKMPATWPAL